MHRIPLPILLIGVLAASGVVCAENEKDLHDTGRVCAVDMGSNTFKFIVAEIRNGEYLQYLDERKTAGVGDDLKASEKQTGEKVISDSKIQEIRTLISGFQDQCQQETGSRKIHGIATSAFREAENGKAVSDLLRQQGVDVRILTGEEESIYAYEAATLGASGLAVVDLGSRTTEFVSRNGGTHQWRELATGYKVAWDAFYEKEETFSQASSKHLSKLQQLITEEEIKILRNRNGLVMIEVGEAASYILGVPQNQIEGRVITRSQLQNKLNDLHAMNAKGFAHLKQTFQDAAKVLPRLVLAHHILEKSGYGRFRATDRELNVAIVYNISRRQAFVAPRR